MEHQNSHSDMIVSLNSLGLEGNPIFLPYRINFVAPKTANVIPASAIDELVEDFDVETYQAQAIHAFKNDQIFDSRIIIRVLDDGREHEVLKNYGFAVALVNLKAKCKSRGSVDPYPNSRIKIWVKDQ